MALVTNKKAHLYYVIVEKIEAGIELFGHEVKSLRLGHGSLDGARIIVRGGEAYMVGSFIPAYQEKNTPKEFDAYRTRKLILKKNEIAHLHTSKETKNLTSVPISLYIKNNLIKLEVALSKKKEKGDKRETIKKDIAKREMRVG